MDPDIDGRCYGAQRPTLLVIVWGSLDSDSGMSKSPLSDIWETQPTRPLLYLPMEFISIDGKPPVRNIELWILMKN
jgi:hypothetical protein